MFFGDDSGAFDGRDFLKGGGGPDLFVWTSIAESRTGFDQADVITDLSVADNFTQWPVVELARRRGAGLRATR